MASQTTRVLSAEEQKHTLSGKKKFKKTTLRNVLSTPFADYWPVVTPQDETEIGNILKKDLKQLKPPKLRVPWNVMKTIPKEQRRAFRIAHSSSSCDDYRSHLVFGTNEVTKLLESNLASSVLISADVDPKFLVKHIVDMCVLRKVPVLAVPNLKNILKEVTGLVGVTIAFKCNTNYAVIDEKIKQLYKNYQPLIAHISTHTESNEETQMEVVHKDNKPSQTNVYLYRKSKTQRVFIPELSVKRDSLSTFIQTGNESLDFISLGDNPVKIDTKKEVRTGTKVSYKSLLLKRVTSNKNRDKKKIEQLKMKTK
ncbi:hypothetical protein RN001_013438 [Aquatica leii]|uniref:Ribosomal protein eL8/eL30/eS12/Gadd45 domain-containing protein n=1 Tax=Aquatica leii TaxID=1421715 RepID=A0AAN7SLL5_9COLE|nr:hypothetical protein RN001_013438 [Aquatica leii]